MNERVEEVYTQVCNKELKFQIRKAIRSHKTGGWWLAR